MHDNWQDDDNSNDTDGVLVVGTCCYKFSESITDLSYLHCSLNNILPPSDILITVECIWFDKQRISQFKMLFKYQESYFFVKTICLLPCRCWKNCLFQILQCVNMIDNGWDLVMSVTVYTWTSVNIWYQWFLAPLILRYA